MVASFSSKEDHCDLLRHLRETWLRVDLGDTIDQRAKNFAHQRLYGWNCIADRLGEDICIPFHTSNQATLIISFFDIASTPSLGSLKPILISRAGSADQSMACGSV